MRKCPVRRPCVVDTSMGVDVNSANASITDGVATSNIIGTTVEDEETPDQSTAPVSRTKLAGTIEKIQGETEERVTGYRFIYISSKVFILLACPICGHTLISKETDKQRLSFELNAVCNSGENDCQWEHTLWTSKKII